jgi:Transmembrane secretion effector
MVGTFALVYMAGVAILVLFAQQELGLGNAGFGLLLAAIAVGGLPGNLLAPAVGRRLRAGTLLIGGTLVAAAAWLAVGLAPSVWAAVALVLVGLVGSIWDVAQLSLRQLLIPDPLLGRVISAFRLVGFGAGPGGRPARRRAGPHAGPALAVRVRRSGPGGGGVAGAAGREHPLGGGRPRPGAHCRRGRSRLRPMSRLTRSGPA